MCKVLRSGTTAFDYAREMQPLPKVGPWRADLDRMLVANEAKSTRERLTLIRVFEELRGLGYAGGYDAVRRYARSRRRARGMATSEAFVPLSFAPGEAYQFDWSQEIVVLNGVTTTVKVAHVRLCHSRIADRTCRGRRSRFRRLDQAGEWIAVGRDHAAAQLGGEQPGGLDRVPETLLG